MMKKIVLIIALLSVTPLLMAMQAEQAYLYKDSRIMGKGGTSVANGQYATSVFSNPAGLASLRKSEGFIVDFLSLGVAITAKSAEFVNDVNDGSDSVEDLENILNKYNGENFHLGINNYSSISKNSQYFTWSIGILAASDVNVMAHSDGTPSGDYLESSSRVYGGVVFGVAKPFYTKYGRLDIGISTKYISQSSYEGTVGVAELVNSDEDYQEFIKRYEKKASGLGFDMGVNYHPFANSYWNLILGMSVMNIGLDLDDNYGHQPMSVNFGLSISPELSFVDKFVLALDYVDILGANKYRQYNKSSNGSSTSYVDYDAYDTMKNIRIGAGIGLIDTSFFSMDVDVGLYQSAYTAGLMMKIALLKLNLATYQEDVGINSSTSNPDRRYMLDLGIVW